jgi:putative hydrolase of the HAD superfamily
MARPAGRPAKPVRAVVFDFGGVLITPITTGVSRLAARHDVTTAVMLEVLLGPDDSSDHPWHRAERGELTVAEIQSLLAEHADAAGVVLAGDEIDELLVPGFVVNDAVVAAVAALARAGIRTALLTNTFREFRPTLERVLDLSMFDAVVESYAVGARKPEAAIYEATSEALGVPHDEIAFLDDFAQNLAAAERLGWRTVAVEDVTSALAGLRDLVDVPLDGN